MEPDDSAKGNSMDFWESLRVLWRRWATIVPVLLLTVAFGVAAWLAGPSEYEAKSAVLLLPSAVALPAPDGTVQPINPYLAFDPSLGVTAQVLGQTLMSDRAVKENRARGASEPYTVSVALGGAAPVLEVVTLGASPKTALRTRDILVEAIGTQLLELQEAALAPESTFIQTKLVSETSDAQLQVKSKIQTVTVVAVLGIVGSLSLGFMAERRAIRRRDRRAANLDNLDVDFDAALDRELTSREMSKDSLMGGSRSR